MTSLVLQPVRVQAALAGLLGLLAAILCGWWLAAAGSGSSALQRINLGPRSLPKLTAEGDPALRRNELLAQQQGFISKKAIKTTELTSLTEHISNLQEEIKQSDIMTPEKQKVETIKMNTPDWDQLKHENFDEPKISRLTELWKSGTDTAEKEALDTLATLQTYWETAMKNVDTLRQERTKALPTMRITFNAESVKILASLRYADGGEAKAISQAEADQILEAIKKLLSGDLRASPGEDLTFTNIAGIELVWVPEGKFWIGKTEVSEKQYNFVINGKEEGADKPKDGVSVTRAREYCESLNHLEGQNAKDLDNDTNRLKPEDFDYALPSVAQWRLGKKSKESLLSGMDTEPYEWTSNQHGDAIGSAFPQVGAFRKPYKDTYPVLIHGNSLVTVEPTTTSSISAGFGRTAPYWIHQIGFRIILIPRQGQP